MTARTAPTFVAGLIAASLAGCAFQETGIMSEQEVSATEGTMRTVFDFTNGIAAQAWRPVNDSVMGGISQGGFHQPADGPAVFSGTVSLENFGGFASVRAPYGRYDLSGHAGLAAHVRGDGKRYRFVLKMNDRDDGYLYWADFDTRGGEWTTVRLPFASFSPTYRGLPLFFLPSVDPARIRAVGLLIADSQAGPFRLEVQWIKAYRRPPIGLSPSGKPNEDANRA